MIEKILEDMKNEFWTQLEELVHDVEEATGAFAEDWCHEYVVISHEEDGEDVQTEIRLGGTGRTITIESFEEVYRG